MSFLNYDPRMLAPGRYFLLIDLAAGMFAVWAVLLATGAGGGGRTLLQLAWTLLLFVLFFRRGQDEFWDACWRRATSVAFLALIVVPFGWGFIEGLVDGFTTDAGRIVANAGSITARETEALYYPSFDGIITILFATFFATFQWTRFRGVGR